MRCFGTSCASVILNTHSVINVFIHYYCAFNDDMVIMITIIRYYDTNDENNNNNDNNNYNDKNNKNNNNDNSYDENY